MKAIKVYKYFEIYRMYIVDNLLDDDSHSISVKGLIDFVDNFMNIEDKLEYEQRIK